MQKKLLKYFVTMQYYGDRVYVVSELEDDHRSSVVKQHNPTEFGLVKFVFTNTVIPKKEAN